MWTNQRVTQRIDWSLVAMMCVVPLLGLTVLYSAGYDHSHSDSVATSGIAFARSPAFLKQLVFFSLGFLVVLLTAAIPTRYLQRLAWVVYFAGVGLLIAVALFGTIVNGSRRWLSVAGMNIQPAEFMKLGVILALARFMSKNPPREGGYRLLDLWQPALIFLIPMALIMKQPDLGTALSVGAVGGMMLLFAGVRLRTLVTLAVVGGIGIVPFWYQLHDYQRNRILSLFNSERDPQGTGYHIIQSKIAVGSGELFGKGYLQGTQTQLEFLPEHTTDFIFSVLAEEWGFLGCVIVLIAYFFLVLAMLRVAARARSLFAAFVVVGITSQIFFHSFVNIGMVVGILPVVGIPLPLFSYGGSSVLSTLFGIGIVHGVGMRRGRGT